ncbi:topoisomerase I [Endogone sp. FLAS-F59071]|nr:topoisomerase I [Endogone sp. FLAS-F59071]|eukprot:RUS17779.1 topoisomerase I [Endogone sp. FLAS-F59071]
MSESEDDTPLSKRIPALSSRLKPAPSKSSASDSEDDAAPSAANIKSNETIADDSSDDDIPLAMRVSGAAPAAKKEGKPVTNGSKPAMTAANDTNGKADKRKIEVKQEDTDEDSDVPLIKKVKKGNTMKAKATKLEKDDAKPKKSTLVTKDSKPDKALAKRRKELDAGGKDENKKRRKAKVEDSMSESDEPPNRLASANKGKRVKLDEDTGDTKRSRKKKKDDTGDEDDEMYKWWEAQAANGDQSEKWKTLEHAGVLFPPPYVPHGVRMKYDGKEVELEPEAEEVASFFAALLGSDHAKNVTFQKNFFRDWQEILKKSKSSIPIKEFAKCDFTPMFDYFEAEKEKKKAMTRQEKQKQKEEKTALEEKYMYAMVDGRKEKVGNFRIEPPGLFRGRGAHPKTGCLKKRVLPEQVTLNIGEKAKVPEAPEGHSWCKVVHDHTATWLATWKENVNGSIKYVFLGATSAWKGQSDMMKFEKARELKKHVDKIRREYSAELKDKVTVTRQRATAMYLIDRFALRAGNEKGEDEADTVGCCSLRFEHVTLEPPNTVIFDFLGKDSIRYYNRVQVDLQVFKNLKIFKREPKRKGDMLFDRLNTALLNKHLSSYMPGLTAKVFRTYNASHVFQEELCKIDSSDPDKVLGYNRANRQVAVLCNHQRSVAKSHDQQMKRMEDKVRALKYEHMKVRQMILTYDPKQKKKRPELTEMESDLDDEWIKDYDGKLIEKEREKVRQKFEKDNQKLEEEGKAQMSEKELKNRMKEVDEKVKELENERRTGKVEPKKGATLDKLEALLEKKAEKVRATKVQAVDKEEGKETALSTSKINYIDPRITVAWCRKFDVPFEKVFNRTLRDKFQWAMNTDKDWEF